MTYSAHLAYVAASHVTVSVELLQVARGCKHDGRPALVREYVRLARHYARRARATRKRADSFANLASR